MKTFKKFYLWAFIVIIAFCGCAPAYIPTVINTPLLSKEGEFQAALNTGVSGFDPQFAYAITDHIGVMLNGSYINQTNDTLNNFHKHLAVESGVGYYTKIGNSGRFEVFGGLGYSRLQADYSNNLWISRTDLNSMKIFIQPAIGASTDILDGSFATRFVRVTLFQDQLQYTGFFIEPVLTAKVGYKFVKFVMQVGFSIPVNSNELVFSYQPFLISVGIQTKLNFKK
jgi:hypothetical protein